MAATWILAADSARARIFEAGAVDTQLHEVEDFLNPGARQADRDLRTGADGRYHGSVQQQSGNLATSPKDPVEHETEWFAKRIADYLDKARNEHRYAGLCLIAAPKFLGLLRANLPHEVQKLVSAEIDKDLSKASAAEIGRAATENRRSPRG